MSPQLGTNSKNRSCPGLEKPCQLWPTRPLPNATPRSSTPRSPLICTRYVRVHGRTGDQPGVQLGSDSSESGGSNADMASRSSINQRPKKQRGKNKNMARSPRSHACLHAYQLAHVPLVEMRRGWVVWGPERGTIRDKKSRSNSESTSRKKRRRRAIVWGSWGGRL